MVKIGCGVKHATGSGRERKRAGQLVVLSGTELVWRASVVALIANRGRGRRFTADDVRDEAAAKGIPNPHHPNAWGALFTQLSVRGEIERVDYCESKRERSRARIVSVWVRPKLSK